MAEAAVGGGDGGGTVRCAACGHGNPPGMRFCGFCGQALAAAAPSAASPDAPEAPPAASSAASVAPPAVPEVSSVPAVPAPTAPPAAPERPKPVVTIPADPIAREVERDKLFSLANAQRMRGHVTDARETLEKVLALSEAMPPREIAPVHEQIGDLLMTEERLEEAVAAYSRAHAIDPARVSAEKKYANVTLEIANRQGKLALSPEAMKGDGLVDIISEGGRVGKRNAGVAMLLSVVPGFGQFYNGQFVKGLVILGVFILALLIISIQPDRDEFFQNFALTVNLRQTRGSLSPLTVGMALVALGAWLFSLVDAPYYAGKVSTDAPMGMGGGTVGDKSGWEP